MKRITAILMGIGISLAFAGCTSQSLEGQQEQVNFFGMDTYMTITAYGEDAGEAVEEAQARILELEKEWSVTDESSQIYQANHSGGSPVTLSDDTRDVVSFALEMAEKTGGALEPTIYPVLEAWGFTTDENRIPAPDEIQTLLEHVGYEQVSLSGNELTLPEGVELDLGAVGKGYAGDAAAEVIKEQGVTSALLDLGGNIQAVGKRPDGTGWRIGIRNPFGDGQMGMLLASDCAVVTSGSYERYFVGEDGKEYTHIIDPETGYPVDNGLVSVSIIAEEGKVADALSTSMFVKGLEGAEECWKEHQDFEMIAVTEDGDIYVTEGIEDQFTLGDSFGNMELHIITS
ncbi:FAD:protein FMN transferase [Merdimonas faecis]